MMWTGMPIPQPASKVLSTAWAINIVVRSLGGLRPPQDDNHYLIVALKHLRQHVLANHHTLQRF